MLFNAKLFKQCWSNARRTTSSDANRPVLTCMLVDVFPDHGLRVVTTDSYTMLETWIPVIGDAPDRWTLDHWPDRKTEAPLQLLIHDQSNTLVAPCAGAYADNVVELTADAGGLELASTFQLGRQAVTLAHIDQYEFPSWQPMFVENTARPAPGFDRVIGFDPARLAPIMAIVGKEGGEACRLRWVDHLKPVHVYRPGSHHRGIVMPMHIDPKKETA